LVTVSGGHGRGRGIVKRDDFNGMQEMNRDQRVPADSSSLYDFLTNRDLEGVFQALGDLGVKKPSQLRFITEKDLDGLNLSVVDSRALKEAIESEKNATKTPESKEKSQKDAGEYDPRGEGPNSRKGQFHQQQLRSGYSANTEVAAGPTYSTPKSCIFAFLREGSSAFKNQHQVRRFLIAAYNHGDDTQLVSMLGSGTGLARLKEICTWPFSVKAGNRADILSFQRVVVPLLRLVTKDEFQSSMLSQYLNPIYATLHQCETFEQHICVCLADLTKVRSIDDPFYSDGKGQAAAGPVDRWGADDVWAPASWVDVFQPVSQYALQVVQRFRESHHSASTRALADRCHSLATEWRSWNPHPQAQATLDGLDLSLKIFARAARQLEQAQAREKSAERELLFSPAPVDGIYPAEQDGPGEMRRAGCPRHDNDHAQIRNINVAPTCGEALSLDAPFLPRNAPTAPHHLAGAERLLDVHFRLLREDFLRTLRTGVAAYWHEDSERGRARSRRGRFEFAGGESMFVFTSPAVVGIACDVGAGISFEVEFDDVAQNAAAPRDKRMQFWKRSRRLQLGCLVCLCWKGAADTPSLVFGTVSGRDESDLAPAQLRLRPRFKLSTRCSGTEFDDFLFRRMLSPQNEADTVILQASDDYFSYEPVLSALQKLEPAVFPLESYLASWDTSARADKEVAPPSFVTPETKLDLSSLLNAAPQHVREQMTKVQILAEPARQQAWQLLREYSTLDDAQARAIECALTRELVLIQGPPGTGDQASLFPPHFKTAP
jgi:hypothetical protein